MLELLADPAVWASFLTLVVLEIVLGVDNVIFISIAAARLPEDQRARARMIGLTGALVMRILLLLSIAWITGLAAFWKIKLPPFPALQGRHRDLRGGGGPA